MRRLLGRGKVLYVALLAAVAALGGFLFGFDSGVINGTVQALRRALGAGAWDSDFAVAIALLGSAAGAFVAGNLADRFGRKPALLATAVAFLVSLLGAGLAGSVPVFDLWRLLGGFAIGAASVLSPLYIAEVAPAALRGRLAALQQLAIVLGLFIAFVSNYLLAGAAGGAAAPLWGHFAAWRWMFWVGTVPALALFAGALLIPESPRYLVSAGKLDQAAAVFRRLGADAAAEVEEVRRSLEARRRPRLGDLLAPGTGRLRPIVWVGIALSVFQQFVGINVFFYYGEVLWEAAGSSESSALAKNVVTGTVNIVATLIAIGLIDRVGRKPLLTAGSVGMFLALAALAVIFGTGTLDAAGGLHLGREAAWAGVAAANLYILAFGVSWGPAVWVLLGEMFGNQYRGLALAVAAAAQWLANFAVTLTFPLLLRGVGLAGAYSLYATAALLSLFFVLRFVPETRGKRLEEM
jgi:SP family sugar:H+ symporter-like MFS transporter